MKLSRQQHQQEQQQQKRFTSSIRSKAVHFVSDLTTVILNPISDKPSVSYLSQFNNLLVMFLIICKYYKFVRVFNVELNLIVYLHELCTVLGLGFSKYD